MCTLNIIPKTKEILKLSTLERPSSSGEMTGSIAPMKQNFALPCYRTQSSKFWFRSLYAVAFVCSLILMLCPEHASAEQSFSWKDKQGRIFFGSNPPKGAKEVKKLNTKKLSRYSTKKMLKHLGWEKRAKLAESKSTTSNSPSVDEWKSDDITTGLSTNLEHNQVEYALDEKSQITSCLVSINNQHPVEISQVSVAFEFPDGTLLPGVGPDTIKASEAVEFRVPDDLLPLVLEPEVVDQLKSDETFPKVISQGILPK